jgi:hypothetical protein
VNPTEKTTEPNESRKWSILLGIAVVARVLIGVAAKEDPFLIFANLVVLYLMVVVVERFTTRKIQ